jgi:hypothetical protein
LLDLDGRRRRPNCLLNWLRRKLLGLDKRWLRLRCYFRQEARGLDAIRDRIGIRLGRLYPGWLDLGDVRRRGLRLCC